MLVQVYPPMRVTTRATPWASDRRHSTNSPGKATHGAAARQKAQRFSTSSCIVEVPTLKLSEDADKRHDLEGFMQGAHEIRQRCQC